MNLNHAITVTTTVEALVKTLSFATDCRIEGYLPGGDKALLTQLLPRGHNTSSAQPLRLVRINDKDAITDSGELKQVLLQAARDARGDAAITVSFVPADAPQATPTRIESSVLSNGVVSEVEKVSPEKVHQMLEELQPPSATLLSTVTATPPPQLPTKAPPHLHHHHHTTNNNNNNNNTSNNSNSNSNNNNSFSSDCSSMDFNLVQINQLSSPDDQMLNNNNSRAAAAAVAAAAAGMNKNNNTLSTSSSSTTAAAAAAAATTTSNNSNSNSPQTDGVDLLEFEKMKLSMQGDEALKILSSMGSAAGGGGGGPSFGGGQRGSTGATALNNTSLSGAMASSGREAKDRLRHALERVQPGCCVLCVVQDVNPIAEIELLALAQKKRIVSLDMGLKLRLRPKPADLAAAFAEAMRTGAWFVMVNAHKSISTCAMFDEILTEAQGRNLEGFDPGARIIISLEPHPHFPKHLIQNSVVVKLVSNLQSSAIFADSLATSMSRNRLVTADALAASQRGAPTGRAFSIDSNAAVTAAATTAAPPAMGGGGGAPKSGKKHVRISAAVDVVDIAPREVLAPAKKESSIDVSGSVALMKTFTGVLNDKFLCVRSVGEPGRFAVGSAIGNIYFLDSLGNSLLQAHVHDAAIWDLRFADRFHFATGCEDGSAASWLLSATTDGETSLVPTSATSLGADVYCVSYLRSEDPDHSPLLIGGLHNSIVLRVPQSEEVRLVDISSNAQVIDTLPHSSHALIGGGDGSVTVVDVTAAATLGRMAEHTRKLPALSVRDDNHFFTGGFDSRILSWDLRVPGGCVASVDGTAAPGISSELSAKSMHTLKLTNYITGLDVDDVHLAASVGENLYIWDVRKLNTVLGGYPQGWKGLSRGIKIESMSHVVVTASPDGYVRFWNFV